MEPERAEEIIDRFRPLVDAEIGRVLEGRDGAALYEMVRYHLGFVGAAEQPTVEFGGKRVRAALCLLVCEGVGGEAAAAAAAAAAIELVHAFTLLHDDVADEDELRRGRVTVWRRWGVGQAITAGDATFALANLAAASLVEGSGIPAEAVCAVMRELNQATLIVSEGQHLDIAYEGRTDISVDDYVEMIAKKTAALFAAAPAIGAIAGAAFEEQRRRVRDFGRHLGLAYQVRDDVLGIWGDPERLGKPVGGDLRRSKRSLPIVYALSSGAGAERERLAERLREGIATEEAAEVVARSLEEMGAREFCERMVEDYSERALADLGRAELRQGATADLRVLTSYLTERTS